jgi:hypothetical protein
MVLPDGGREEMLQSYLTKMSQPRQRLGGEGWTVDEATVSEMCIFRLLAVG